MRYRPFAPNPDFVAAWREGRVMDLAAVAAEWAPAMVALAPDVPGDASQDVEADEPPF